MRTALLLDEDWETAARIVRLLSAAGHAPVVNPGWDELDGFDLGVVRANYWQPGLGDRFAKALVLSASGTPLLNSIAALLCCADKAVGGELMRRAGLYVPATWILGPDDPLPQRDHAWVVKPRVGAHQSAVEVFHDRQAAQRYLSGCASEQVVQARIAGRQWRVIATPTRAVRTYTMPLDARGVTALPDGMPRTVVDRPGRELEGVAVTAVGALAGDVLGVDVIEDADGRYWALEGNAGFGFNLGDAAVEEAILGEAEALVSGRRPGLARSSAERLRLPAPRRSAPSSAGP